MGKTSDSSAVEFSEETKHKRSKRNENLKKGCYYATVCCVDLRMFVDFDDGARISSWPLRTGACNWRSVVNATPESNL